MKILGIESTCDETAAAVVEDGKRLLSNVVVSQIDIHAEYGGVIPEVAARSHIEAINPVIQQAMRDADCSWDDIDGIAVSYAPGLVGSLLVGTLAARTLAVTRNIPLYPVHHVEAHVYANFIVESKPTETNPVPGGSSLQLPTTQPKFPMLALIVSGAHSQLVLFNDHGRYQLLGETQDDAVGEAFDKVAKILGLPYPGGPSLAAAAIEGDSLRYSFPIAKLKGEYDFSFSGLKTAVLRSVQRETGNDFTFPSHELAGLLTTAQRNDFAASFQRIAVKTLVDKTLSAYHAHSPASVIIAGGVAANSALREQLAEQLPIAINYTPMQLCTDNGAMVAALGYYRAQRLEPVSPLDLEVKPSISMVDTVWG